MALYGMEVQTRKGCQSFDSPLCCQLPTGQVATKLVIKPRPVKPGRDWKLV